LENLADEMIAQAGELDPVEDRLLEDMFRGVVKNSSHGIERECQPVAIFTGRSQQSGDSDLRSVSYREMVQQHTMRLRSLDRRN